MLTSASGVFLVTLHSFSQLTSGILAHWCIHACTCMYMNMNHDCAVLDLIIILLLKFFDMQFPCLHNHFCTSLRRKLLIPTNNSLLSFACQTTVDIPA